MMENATPAMKQYLQIKDENKDALLLYRMGDFYELFFDDAITASKALNITLTKRGYHNNEPIPMCGIPYHALNNYLPRLIKDGFKVALCEQVEDPKEAKLRAGSSAIVKREVVKVLTSGTIIEDNLISDSASNFLCVVIEDEKFANRYTIAYADITTGSFFVEKTDNIESFIQRINVGEIIISETLKAKNIIQDLISNLKFITVLPDFKFNKNNNIEIFQNNFNVADFVSIGDFDEDEILVAGVLIGYVQNTSKIEKCELKNLSKKNQKNILQIDSNTWKNLEITHSINGDKKASLFYCLNKTNTSGGTRYLNSIFSNPITDIDELNNRLKKQEYFIKNLHLIKEIEKKLDQMPDIERALTRILYNRSGPRDLDVIKKGLQILPEICIVLSYIDFENEREMSAYNISDLVLNLSELKDVLQNALKEFDLPLLARDGNFIKEGFNSQLDEFKQISENANSVVDQLQERYKKECNAISLKVKNNNILGYYIEVPTKQADFLLKQENGFIHRQTLINCIRFTTNELFELQQKIESAGSKILSIELDVFEQLNQMVKNNSQIIYNICSTLSDLDVFVTLAKIAIENNFCKPSINNSTNLIIENGRHFVVENFLKKELKDFIPNNCVMSDKDNENSKIWLLTGPNMAGKSTYLRANALIVFMAHCGLYVPAEKAEIGIVDKIFSRIGASDNLSKGQSTFMMEMIETASILNQASDKSFVILDEIGRGTSTYDGVSIASSTLQYIHNIINCRCLFATHYHELTQLSESLVNLSNHTMDIKEFNNDVFFMHKVKLGKADKSYGIWVAKLAGMPNIVINNAKKILEVLEKNNKDDFDLPLFNNIEENNESIQNEKREQIIEELKAVNLDTLTPLDAMNILYNLRKKTD